MTASHALLRSHPIYHMSDSCHFRVDGTGQLSPIDIDEQVINMDPSLNVNWANADFDQWSINHNNIGALWQPGTDLTRPPSGLELQSSAYQNTLVNKARCPSAAALVELIGQEAFDEDNRFVIEQIGIPGGLLQYLANFEGRIVVMKGNYVPIPQLIIHPHHLDKQVRKAGGPTRFWNEMKRQCANMAERIQRMAQQAAIVRQFLCSIGYVANNQSDSGKHSYATSNWLHGVEFWFCHDDRSYVHLTRSRREHSKSFVGQTLDSADTERAHAIGLDITGLQAHQHLVSFDLPVPSSSSTHISCGPASSPILGCIVTVTDTSYRPTPVPIKFRFANPSLCANPRAKHPLKDSSDDDEDSSDDDEYPLPIGREQGELTLNML
eukprot:scaffold7473_cov118-Skeletonema_menzelii.AAC.2